MTSTDIYTDHFVQNKYSTWYARICANRKIHKHNKSVYTEKHHIIPKCIGGTNESSNIVRLSAREHYIVHRLIVKFSIGNTYYKMLEAFSIFTHNKNRKLKFNSRDIELMRIANSKASSIRNMGNTAWKSRIETIESREKRSKKSSSCRWVTNGDKDNFTDCPEEFIAEGYRYGRKQFSDKALHSMSNVTKKICPHCSKEISIGNYKRAHGDNCKHNPENKQKQEVLQLARLEKHEERKKAYKLATIKRKEDAKPLTCIHCGFASLSRSNMKQHHGDNCKHNPNISEESINRKRLTAINNSLGQARTRAELSVPLNELTPFF